MASCVRRKRTGHGGAAPDNVDRVAGDVGLVVAGEATTGPAGSGRGPILADAGPNAELALFWALTVNQYCVSPVRPEIVALVRRHPSC